MLSGFLSMQTQHRYNPFLPRSQANGWNHICLRWTDDITQKQKSPASECGAFAEYGGERVSHTDNLRY